MLSWFRKVKVLPPLPSHAGESENRVLSWAHLDMPRSLQELALEIYFAYPQIFLIENIELLQL